MNMKTILLDSIKQAMKNKEKEKLTTLRMFSAAIKQREVDERIELTEEDCLKVLTTMIKQRKDAHQQFADAGRDDLASKEAAEIEILNAYLPVQLSEDELQKLITTTIESTQAQGMKDMGKVMNELRPQIQGKADPAHVSALIKAKLQG